jgi:uncharacterized protein YdhG (YjbR/CyaY superfamily)
MQNVKAENVDDYIASFPKEIQEKLQKVRLTIKKAVPEASEKISYAIPTFTIDKTYLVYFAAFKSHIGFYPTPVAAEEFKEELLAYKTGKGSVQFPYHQEIPFDLITRIVKFRMKEIAAKSSGKK